MKYGDSMKGVKMIGKIILAIGVLLVLVIMFCVCAINDEDDDGR